MDAKAFFKERAYDNPFTDPTTDWGNLNNTKSPHNPPPVPDNWPADAKQVWNPKLMTYVKGVKQFNYVPNIGIWLNRQKAARSLAVKEEHKAELRRRTERNAERKRNASIERRAEAKRQERKHTQRRSRSRSHSRHGSR